MEFLGFSLLSRRWAPGHRIWNSWPGAHFSTHLHYVGSTAETDSDGSEGYPCMHVTHRWTLRGRTCSRPSGLSHASRLLASRAPHLIACPPGVKLGRGVPTPAPRQKLRTERKNGSVKGTSTTNTSTSLQLQPCMHPVNDRCNS